LQFLARVVDKETRHLNLTSRRLFTVPFTADRVAKLETAPELAERVDAFVSRFGRLQDNLGDKLLPILLRALGEKTGAVIDNLDRAERLGLIPSADQWTEIRKLRNQMVHDYVEDPRVLADALEAAHGFVPVLTNVANRIRRELDRRGWLAEDKGLAAEPISQEDSGKRSPGSARGKFTIVADDDGHLGDFKEDTP
jgi:hypothetical protein